MRLPALDERLACAAALFPACEYGADIGADHGRLSCALLASGKCRRMCVADISAESLEKAKRLLRLHGLGERADFSVSDGLAALSRRADAIAILGMGGCTLADILLRGRERLQGAALILSAHTQIPHVRETLTALGYRIDEEQAVRVGGRFYVVLRALPGAACYSPRELLLGPCLMRTGQGAVYRDYVAWRREATACEQDKNAKTRLQWLEEEYARVCHSEND